MVDMDDDTIKGLMHQAFEQAFQAQLGHLYKVYISNMSTPEQAARTKTGIDQAVEAYKRAISAVDNWESNGG